MTGQSRPASVAASNTVSAARRWTCGAAADTLALAEPNNAEPNNLAAVAIMPEPKLPSIVGVVGLSPLGEAIARRLAARGVRVAAYDGDRGARARLAGASPLIEAAASLADVGHDCEVVLATLDGGALAATMIGTADEPGLGLLLAPGSLVVDMGASAPHDARRLAFVLGARGIGLVDAPALGTPQLAAASALAIPAGGFPDFVERATGVLDMLGKVTRAGQIGSGHTLAALLTAKAAAEALIDAELAALAAAAGLAPAALAPTPLAARRPEDGPSHDGDPAVTIRLAVARGLAGQHGAASLQQIILSSAAAETARPCATWRA